MSRRRFLRSLAAAPLLPTVLAQAPTPPSPAPPAPSPTPAIPSPASPSRRPRPHRPGPSRRPWATWCGSAGAQLEEADLAEVRKGIEHNLQAADRLRKGVKLANGDEPVNIFRPRVAPPPPPVTRRRRR